MAATSPFRDLKAGHIAIRTTEYGAVIKWYREKLDFRLVREFMVGDMQLAFLALPGNDQFLIEILGVNNTGQAANPDGQSEYDHICFNVEDLDTTIETLARRDIEIIRNFRVPAIGKRVAFIADPFGNRIELCEDIKIDASEAEV